jgi:hypothetical protein
MTENYTDEEIVAGLVSRGFLSPSIDISSYKVDENFRFLANKFTLDTAINVSANHLVNVSNAIDYGIYLSGAVQLPPVAGVKGRDVFDLPSADLKKLVQGVIWRDEHFSGTKMSDIAKRENCSDRHVRKVIMRSFDTLLSA